MTMFVNYAQFLAGNGVPMEQANAVAAGIDSKVARRTPLTPVEAALSAAFLARPGANLVAEQTLAQAVNASNDPASGQATGKRQHSQFVFTKSQPSSPPTGRKYQPNTADGSETIGTPQKIKILSDAASGRNISSSPFLMECLVNNTNVPTIPG